jgi:hypothetical protein
MSAVAATLLLFLSGANPFLDEGRRLYDAMLYENATAQLRLAAEAPTSTREERREAVDLLARALAAQGLDEQAEREYAKLLGRDPNAPSPVHASPKIRTAFQRAKARLYPPNFVSLTPVAATSASIEVDVTDPWQLVRELALESSQGEAVFERQRMDYQDGRASGHFGVLGDAPVRYYVVAEGEERRVLAQLGSEDKPLLLPRPELPPQPPPRVDLVQPPPAPAEPVSRKPAWILTSAAVVAAAVGTGLAVSSASDARTAKTAWASQVGALNNSAWNKALGADISIGGAVLCGAGAAYAALR